MSSNDPYSTPQYGQQPYGGLPAHGAPMPSTSYQVSSYGPPLANWGQRVGAYLIDALVLLPAYVLFVVAVIIIGSSTSTTTQCDTSGFCQTVTTGSPSPWGFILTILGFLAVVALQIWNRWVKGGKGQSIGKKALGISLISETTGRPIGTGMAFVRDLAHFLDGIACYIGYLWPLWDNKRQTFSDKVMSTLVVQGPPPGEKH